MLKNYIIIALRNIKKHKGFSFINISGLAIGMACCLLILLYIRDELSYDRYHEKSARIYRILSFSTIGGVTRRFAISPAALAPAVTESIPEIESYVRVFNIGDARFRYQDRNFEMSDFYLVDDTFFRIFTHKFIAGDPETCLAEPNAIVISEETAIRIFGQTDVLGKYVTAPGGNRTFDLKITGVTQNVPKNSHFRYNILLSSISIPYNNENNDPAFLNEEYFFNAYAYLLLKKGTNVAEVEAKMMSLVESRWGEMLKQRGVKRDYPLIPLTDIHLRSHYESELGSPGNISYVYLFSAIALFVLFIACFNFINLSTAKSAKRAKEVGLRKVLGAQKMQLIKQFLYESAVISLISLVIGLLLVSLVLPAFNSLTGKEFDNQKLMSLTVLVGTLAIVVVTGFFAGSFPAFILSAFQPVKTVRGKIESGIKNSVLRKVLVIFQFSISIIMIASILIILKQLDYIKNKDLGFDRDHLVVITGGIQGDDSLKERILKNPNVRSVSFSNNVPGQYSGDQSFYIEGQSPDESVRASGYGVDYDFIKTFGMDIVLGRNFSREFSTDISQAVLINEKAARDLGIGEEIIGKQVINIARNNRRQTVVGVVRDFHHKSLKLEINPVIFALTRTQIRRFLSVRISPNNVSDTLSYLGSIWKEINPDLNFAYYFVDEDFRAKYPEEDKVRQVYLSFGILAIFIACLGLYGLASFTVEQRTKEIGIRKVLGASVHGIITKLSKEFILLVLVANVLAWPTAYYIMNNWLDGFAYRINISWWTFALSGLIALMIALLTVSHQSIKSALANPVIALRYE